MIAKLARDLSLRGQGMGDVLLACALEVVVSAAELAGGRAVVVDAVDANAIGFYSRNGFRRLADDSTRLVMKVSTAAAALDRPWPP